MDPFSELKLLDFSPLPYPLAFILNTQRFQRSLVAAFEAESPVGAV
jgi:hypothetical protein